VESLGATEGAPAAGAAELVVDITTTGATLTANKLKILQDGVILKSQCQLAASLTIGWSAAQLAVLTRLMSVIEARAAGRNLCALRWPADQDAAAEPAIAPWLGKGASRQADGVLAPEADLFEVTGALAAAGVGPVSVTRPDYVFEARCAPVEALRARLPR
jgi:ATP phosphoribosyltransferase